MPRAESPTASHALLSTLVDNGVDRVFLVPGESYLGVLDALADFKDAIDTVTCRHESGAGFMACADARLAHRPGVFMVSRGPGASNAAIAVHTAQQDAIPLILIVGQIPKADLRKDAFQEIDYQQMYGSIAKWVVEVTDPAQLATAAFKALRVAMQGTPGPVVLVVPEDVQQQAVAPVEWRYAPPLSTLPEPDAIDRIARCIDNARRPLIVAGGLFERDHGRDALRRLAETCAIPVAVSFRRNDVFANDHPLYVGELGLSNPQEQIALFDDSDLVLALGTRLGDITSQGYRFPSLPKPSQTLVHCYPDAGVVSKHFSAHIGAICDPVALADALADRHDQSDDDRAAIRDSDWLARTQDIARRRAAWPAHQPRNDGLAFVDVVQALAAQAAADIAVCVDAGTFAAPVYRHFSFCFPQRLMAPLSGAMGYGTPAAIATQLRYPGRSVICLVGDGGFLMTGNEMIVAVERQLPILFIVSNNNCYGSIRIHQERFYPDQSDRRVGTGLSNPDFVQVATAFGLAAERVESADAIESALARGLAARAPYLIEVATSLDAVIRPR